MYSAYDCDEFKTFIPMCISRFEAMDPKNIARVMISFIEKYVHEMWKGWCQKCICSCSERCLPDWVIIVHVIHMCIPYTYMYTCLCMYMYMHVRCMLVCANRHCGFLWIWYPWQPYDNTHDIIMTLSCKQAWSATVHVHVLCSLMDL